MSQSDLQIDNVSRSLFRTENNAALQALASLSSGATEPSVMYAYQLWADTSAGVVKLRNAANNAWTVLFSISAGQLAALGGMNLTGAINEERSTIAATATTTPLWDAGTGNIQDWTGTPTITDFPDATQAGARRIAYPAAGTIITDNANIDVQGDATYTVVAGDRIEVEALTTSTFKVWISKKSGASVTAAADGSITPAKLSTGHPEWNAAGLLTVTGTTPDIRQFKSDNPVDQKYWRLYPSSTNAYSIEAVNDAYNTTALAYQIVRSGIAVQSHTWVTNAATRAYIDVNGLFAFNSGYGSAAPAYGVRAWWNFNGTGTPAIRASGGITSITDNGTGDFTLNLATTMPDANYGAAGMAGGIGTSGTVRFSEAAAPTTTAFRINTPNNTGGALVDSPYVAGALFR
jgi:hypothetical protein